MADGSVKANQAATAPKSPAFDSPIPIPTWLEAGPFTDTLRLSAFVCIPCRAHCPGGTNPSSAGPFLYNRFACPGSLSARRWRFSQVPRLPPVCACPALRPRRCPLDSPLRLLDHSLPALTDRRLSQAFARLSSRTTTIYFSGLSHAAYPLATPGFIHTLLGMHAGSLQIRRLTSSDGNWTVSWPHPLGNVIPFHRLLSDPRDLDLT